MKIIAYIPVERIQLTACTYTYRSELMELEVVRVVRHRADRTRERFYYHADVKRPARMHHTAMSYGRDDTVVRVNIFRKENPKWKPPVFPEGVNCIEIQS
ncbi:hypothetical protein AWB80_08154 [Caballeronia pedi]|uniref:Uncharacterized protein n=1 Tax=Caballeronia pedi TaxID=1777141 RepID=A0A158E3X9_9BURK|nr:hypothetical protein [Caballeronia pedi]SAL01562.1 hypothetical protein AWB80_08154 [Caballeronia pedi]